MSNQRLIRFSCDRGMRTRELTSANSDPPPMRGDGAPHNRRVWWAGLALAVGGFGMGMGEFVMLGLLASVAGNFGVSRPRAGHVVSAYAPGVVVGAALIAVAAARWLPAMRRRW